MGDKMKKKITRIIETIFPSKKINLFVLTIIIMGVTCGSIYAVIIGKNDQNQVIEKINTFISNINTNTLDPLIILKNSLGINLIYIILIWILGMTLIGILFIIFLTFSKSFIVGFSSAAFILAYHYKGIILLSLFIITSELLNLIAIIILTIYSLMFGWKIIRLILKKNESNTELRKFLKQYSVILLIGIILNGLSALSTSFILPAIIKLIIKLYI